MRVSLKNLFESKKDRLSSQLAGFTLPQNTDAVYKTVYDYFNEVFDADSEFRQNLTQSEDYILQAAISLLNAQKEMANSMKVSASIELDQDEEPEQTQSFEQEDILLSKFSEANSGTALLGSGVGAVAGKLIFGGWGAVFGALAGTAIAIYLSTVSKPAKTVSKPLVKTKEQPSYPVDVNAFISTISSICASVDNLLDTFRAQINSVVQKYESQPKPTLDSNYRPLLESIQTLVGYERTHTEDDEKFAKKLKERIEDITEVIDTWNIQFVDYDGKNAAFFELIPSEKTQEEKMVFPALIRDRLVILKGKVFIPMEK